jgi:hypothetical protein
MFLAVQTLRNRIIGRATIRDYSAWILCALLLLFCANARLVRYDVQHRNLKLATVQSYVDRDDMRLELSIAALLLLWCVAILPAPRFVAGRVSETRPAILVSMRPGEFDPESHLRPPPGA